MPSIIDLPNIIGNLNPKDKELFHRIFRISECFGELRPPKEMEQWIINQFGSVDAVKRQKIIRVDNIITYEGALFNELRAKRPMAAKEEDDVQKIIDDNKGDPFCTPLGGTPEDIFGRIKGKHCITCSNVAKYDGFHGVVVFNEHNPLLFNEKLIKDYLNTALAWIKEAHNTRKEEFYPFIMWNCLWKSGASLIHGHMQMTLTAAPYIGVEKLNRISDDYQKRHNSDYFEDLMRIHKVLGLAKGNIFCSLSPIKDKETIIFDKEPNAKSLNKVLQAFLKMGVKSFNVAIIMPPLTKSWKKFPTIMRIVDRGGLSNKTADVAAMEMFASQAVIPSDPYKVIEKIK